MRLSEWLEAVMYSGEDPGSGAPDGGPCVDADVASAAQRLQSALEETSALGGSAQARPGPKEPDSPPTMDPPVVLTDSAVRWLLACEQLAVAASASPPDEVTWPMFRGRALDAFVSHVLFTGAVGDTVADLEAMWTASEATEDLALLEVFGSGDTEAEDLARLAAHSMVFSATQRWVPRTEVRMGVSVTSELRLRGRVDVLYGGPGTGLPAVLIEVKSGPLRDEHRAQLRHYVLLAALRHGRVPAGAALWSPVSGLEPLHMGGVIESAAERVARALGVLMRLAGSDGPARSPGPHCRFCPERDDCPVADRMGDGDPLGGEAMGPDGDELWGADL